MGRKSKLSDAQWEEVGRRLANGESTSSLAKEFAVSKTVISERFSKRTEKIKDVANQIVAAEIAFGSLGISEQISARSLADDLKAISMHLGGAGRYGAATAHRLSGIAHAKVAEIDDAAPLDDESRNTLTDVHVLTKMANTAAEIGLNLLKANKDATPEDDAPTPVAITFGVKDAKRADD